MCGWGWGLFPYITLHSNSLYDIQAVLAFSKAALVKISIYQQLVFLVR